MGDIAKLNQKLNDGILNGDALGVFEELYADDVVMQENTEPGCEGKEANRERERQFLAQVEAWHGGRVLAAATSGDVSFSEWEMEVTMKGAGRVHMHQVAVRRWRDGQVVHERFYHA